MTATVTYLGQLRTRCQHIASQSSFITDAPKDNQGQGEAFSPTDCVATSLASCMLTIMGIKANQLAIELTNTTASVTKTMESNPRRIAEIEIILKLPKAIDAKNRKLLEKSAKTCPVAHSLHPDIKQIVHFEWVN